MIHDRKGKGKFSLFSDAISYGFTFKPPGVVQCDFALTCMDEQSMRTATTSGLEIQNIREDDWAESTSPIVIPTILCTNTEL